MNNFAIRPFMGKAPLIGHGVYIDPQAAVIGDVRLGDDVSVWPMAVIRGDVNYIMIGRDCSIQDGAILHVTHDGPYTSGGIPLLLGNGITVGHRAVLHGCSIDDFSLIGMGALIMDGVQVQHHVLVAAGSVVAPGKILEAGHLYLGNPAKLARVLTAKEIEQLEYSAAHYVRLKNKYLETSG
ncbi:MAG: gamma carbonic anhydrase family protein [Legionella sp. 40-6]|nr:gamma carbonic anhydrase family protein [Legionella sp.]OJY04724.1 MAG: gamma carbonic anhydrase family protein [Legionella sp. 40-6]